MTCTPAMPCPVCRVRLAIERARDRVTVREYVELVRMYMWWMRKQEAKGK